MYNFSSKVMKKALVFKKGHPQTENSIIPYIRKAYKNQNICEALLFNSDDVIG